MSANGGRRRNRRAPEHNDRTTPSFGSSPRHSWWERWLPIGPCLTPGTYAALFERTLPHKQQRRVVRHIRRCPRCGPDFYDIAQGLIAYIREAEAREAAAHEAETARTVAPVTRYEWVDSRRLQALMPGLQSSESPAMLTSATVAAIVAELAAESQWPAIVDRHGVLRPALPVLALGLILGVLLDLHVPRHKRVPAPALTARAERLVAPRFTGGLPWAPVVADWHPASAREPYLEPSATRYVETAELRRGIGAGPTADELAAMGTVYALGGRTESGVKALRRAAAAEPESAELLNDFAAALLARAEIDERSRLQRVAAQPVAHDADIIAALELIERALEISPRQPEALFNRALALERLYLRHSARRAWQAYVRVDPGSPWAREARQRLEAVIIPVRPDAARIRADIATAAASEDGERLARLVEAHRHLTHRSVVEDLLPTWGEAALAGNLAHADRQLAAAAAVAAEWEAQTGDTILRKAVTEVVVATGRDRERLAEGYRVLGEANRAFHAFELDVAEAAAGRALTALPVESPATTWAALVRLACMVYGGRDVEMEAARIAGRSRGDWASVGRVNWIAGLWHVRRGELASALADYQESLAAYERIGESESSVAMHHLIGEAYGHMGASDACWKHRRLALERAPTLVDAERAFSIAGLSAMLALFEGRPRVAEDFLNEALASPDLYLPGQLAYAYVWRSRVLHALGKDAAARGELARGSAWAARANPFERQVLLGELELASGVLASSPENAVEALSSALQTFRDLKQPLRMPGILLARARAHLMAGDVAAADADFARGSLLLERQGRGRALDRLALELDDPEKLLDERAQLLLAQGRADEAFAALEAARGRQLRLLAVRAGEGAEGNPVVALLPSKVPARLDGDTTVLSYSWLPDGVWVWRIDRNGLSLAPIRMAPSELARLISALTTDLEAGAWDPTTRTAASKLYGSLLAPVNLTGSRLVIVPDGDLHSLPFASLMNPTSGRFLVEEREITIAPSIDAFLRSRARREARPAKPRDVLSVGDPLTDPVLFPGVRSLPGARREASEVAALYPRQDILLGEAATRTAFLAALGRRDVVHFSGHAIANRIRPEQSSLPLAEAPGSSGLLVAADIARLDLTAVHTVVLSGCETGVGKDGGGEGPLSLARAFLVAGVPNVVASLWPITDAPSAPLMTAFHRRLRQGELPAAALRRAQLDMLRGEEPVLRSPSAWAAFEAFGG